MFQTLMKITEIEETVYWSVLTHSLKYCRSVIRCLTKGARVNQGVVRVQDIKLNYDPTPVWIAKANCKIIMKILRAN